MSIPDPSSPLYYEGDIGPYHWPPAEGEGTLVVSLETELEVETPKPNGKDPVASKVKGKKTVPVTLEFTWTRRADVLARAANRPTGNDIRLALDPHGPNSGKPLDLRNPEPNGRGVDHILIKKASRLTITGDVYRFSLTADGWHEPPPVAVGGTSTPNKAVPANAKIIMGKDLPGGSIPLGEIQPNGFSDPALAPDAEP